ncbi:MAG: CBS domain-containing protein [Planctomycetota bacterium]|jgi:CBS domain-containing protein
MKDKTVQDIMVPVDEYPCIPDTLTIGDAVVEMTVQILRTKHLSLPRVALVFDEDFADLRGMLRRRDIMRGLEPGFLISGTLGYARKLFNVDIDPNLSELTHDKIVAGLRKRSTRLVKDYMVPIPATVNHDDHIMKAVCEMVDQDTSLLPVLKGRHVVGVVRSVDVLSEIALVI